MTGPTEDEHRALRDVAAALMDKRSGESQVRAAMATETGHDAATWAELAELGLLGVTIPEAYGGAGAGYVELGIIAEEMGRTLFCGPYLSTAVLAPALLSASADDAESAAVLPRIAAGTVLAAVAFAEGNHALPPQRPRTVAVTSTDGWQITGAKNFVLDAAIADVLYVLAANDAGPSVFAVDKGAAGVECLPLSTVDQTRKMYQVHFADTPARLVGQLGCGATAFDTALRAGGVALLADQAGGACRAMRMAADYARTRFQFGRAIGSFQAIKHMCADMLLEAESSVSAARHVAAALDADAPSAPADLALAQAYCGEAYVTVAANNIQVHGGIGFTWEHPAHLYLRRARTDAQLFGEPSYHRERFVQRIGG